MLDTFSGHINTSHQDQQPLSFLAKDNYILHACWVILYLETQNRFARYALKSWNDFLLKKSINYRRYLQGCVNIPNMFRLDFGEKHGRLRDINCTYFFWHALVGEDFGYMISFFVATRRKKFCSIFSCLEETRLCRTLWCPELIQRENNRNCKLCISFQMSKRTNSFMEINRNLRKGILNGSDLRNFSIWSCFAKVVKTKDFCSWYIICWFLKLRRHLFGWILLNQK